MRRIEFAQQLRTAVATSGWDRKTLCQRSGVSQAGLSRFINTAGGISLKAACKLADVLELEIKEPEMQSIYLE